jgi:hypothetical protein
MQHIALMASNAANGRSLLFQCAYELAHHHWDCVFVCRRESMKHNLPRAFQMQQFDEKTMHRLQIKYVESTDELHAYLACVQESSHAPNALFVDDDLLTNNSETLERDQLYTLTKTLALLYEWSSYTARQTIMCNTMPLNHQDLTQTVTATVANSALSQTKIRKPVVGIRTTVPSPQLAGQFDTLFDRWKFDTWLVTATADSSSTTAAAAAAAAGPTSTTSVAITPDTHTYVARHVISIVDGMTGKVSQCPDDTQAVTCDSQPTISFLYHSSDSALKLLSISI